MPSFSELLGSGFDETAFAFVTNLKRFQKSSTPYITDRAYLEGLDAMRDCSPQQLFPTPPLPSVSERAIARPWQLSPYGLQYRVKHLTFPSAHPLGQVNNDTVHAYYLYRPGHEQGPTLFYLHGWMAYNPGLWLRPPFSWAEPLGLNIFFMEQPFHMHRSPPGTSSGELSLNGDLMLGLEGVRQAVSDVRASLAWLKTSQGVEKVGLLGRSLGGLVAASTLTVEPGFECAVLDIPAVSPHSSIWRSSYTRFMRAELRKQGLDEQQTAAQFEILRPGRFKPVLEPERIMLIEATADRACFPEETERFAQEWGLTTVKIGFGHMSVILSRQSKRAGREFLARWLS